MKNRLFVLTQDSHNEAIYHQLNVSSVCVSISLSTEYLCKYRHNVQRVVVPFSKTSSVHHSVHFSSSLDYTDRQPALPDFFHVDDYKRLFAASRGRQWRRERFSLGGGGL